MWVGQSAVSVVPQFVFVARGESVSQSLLSGSLAFKAHGPAVSIRTNIVPGKEIPGAATPAAEVKWCYAPSIITISGFTRLTYLVHNLCRV